MEPDLNKVLRDFGQRRVLLIGDTILDIYTYGAALGLSAETPTIVARKKEMKHSLGGAALVCRNLLELGAQVTFVTLVGDDEEAAYVRNFEAPGLEMVAIADRGRPTTVKHRFWVDGYKLFQLDNRDDRDVGPELIAGIAEAVSRRLPDADALVVSDYRHGLLAPPLIASLLAAASDAAKPVFVDSQVAQNASNHTLYRGAGVVCLNLKEARCVDPQFEPRPEAGAFAALRERLGCERIVVKRGEEGALMLAGDQVIVSPAQAIASVDTTGAGDAFLAAFCLCDAGAPDTALRVANAWAGLSIQVHGTSPPCRADLPAALGVG
jgi:rfaE bifunctional protein kinase chain/domain